MIAMEVSEGCLVDETLFTNPISIQSRGMWARLPFSLKLFTAYLEMVSCKLSQEKLNFLLSDWIIFLQSITNLKGRKSRV